MCLAASPTGRGTTLKGLNMERFDTNTVAPRARSCRGRAAVSVCAALLTAAGATLALADAPKGPLSGPTVEAPEAPGETRTFGESQMRDRMMQQVRVRPQTFTRVLRQLSEQEDANLALSQEQKDEINAALTAFRDASEAYRAEHRDEIRELSRTVRAGAPEGRGRGRGQGPEGRRGPQREAEGGEPVSPEKAEAARERLLEIRQNGPDFEQTKALVWTVLTEPQQAYVTGALQQLATERFGGRPDAEMMGGPGGVPGAEAGGPTLETQMDSIRERIEALPEAQQRMILARLSEALDRMEEGQRRAEAPGMDSVEVPDAPRRRGPGARGDNPRRGGGEGARRGGPGGPGV
jgi:hypothetical protein